jgi:peptidoglycan/LPS O-acetylase OafA/YrhL
VLAVGSAQSRDRVLSPLFERLGVRSFTIYMVHFPLLVLLSAYVFETFGRRPMHGWLALAGAIGCVGFGALCFEACERHFRHSRYRDESVAP